MSMWVSTGNQGVEDLIYSRLVDSSFCFVHFYSCGQNPGSCVNCIFLNALNISNESQKMNVNFERTKNEVSYPLVLAMTLYESLS